MRILSISANNFNRGRQNFNGKFLVTNEAQKMIDGLCPSDELIKCVSGFCEGRQSDFLLKLEEASKKELDKVIKGLQLSAYKSEKNPLYSEFIPVKNIRDIECLFATLGEYVQKLN